MARSARRTEVPDLSPSEWEIMKALWDGGAMAARDVMARLEGERDWAPNTVKTLLARLVAKGAVDYEQIGNSYLYRAARSREELTRHEVDEFVERVLDGDAAPVLVRFIRDSKLDEGGIARLRAMLDEKERAATARQGGGRAQ